MIGLEAENESDTHRIRLLYNRLADIPAELAVVTMSPLFILTVAIRQIQKGIDHLDSTFRSRYIEVWIFDDVTVGPRLTRVPIFCEDLLIIEWNIVHINRHD